MGVPEIDPLSQLSLPPGFRFYPTDEELLVQYLCRKVAGHEFSLQIIGDIDLYKFDPWVLPSKAIFGEREWYFFSPRDRKYPNGSRPNRMAGSGYWKATGTDKAITTEGRKVGIKKSLVFYVGKAPKGIKTNWIMHEYRLLESKRKNESSKLDDWVLCRIYKKNSSGQKPNTDVQSNGSSLSSSSQFDDVLEFLPYLDNRLFNLPRMNTFQKDEKLNLQNPGSGKFDWASFAGLNSLPDVVPGSEPLAAAQTRGHLKNNNNQHYDICVPSMQQFFHVDSKFGSNVEEEVENGVRTQQVGNSGFFQQNSNAFSSSPNPFGT